MFCQAACINKKLAKCHTRDFTRFSEVSASVQTNLQSCQKAGSTQELPTNYLPETTAHEWDIPGLCLTTLGLVYYYRGGSQNTQNNFCTFC